MKGATNLSNGSEFGQALKTVRLAKDITQEKFDAVSNRTYVSALERGLKQPTLQKIDELAGVLGVHPLSLLTLCYLKRPSAASVEKTLHAIQTELQELLLSRDG
ncbi:helix-turn-helix domain-containing protein [Variovorax sp. YR216]|uniref:helix-turn-helix domain-containing protein n=1 Tax=Variovorax sp. YR216 TaxID=1882828 RepID=UPI00089DA531|nr:helix-turn-helix transcriptional regulator [Variovorax sp. YR216]SEB16411.1 Helix-turn-helix [Variovorax sp. YR216]